MAEDFTRHPIKNSSAANALESTTWGLAKTTFLLLFLLAVMHFCLSAFLDLIFAGAHDPQAVHTGNVSASMLAHNVEVLTLRRKFLEWLILGNPNDWHALCRIYNSSLREIGFHGLIDATMGSLDTSPSLRFYHTTFLPHAPLLPMQMVIRYGRWDLFLQAFVLKHMAAVHILGRWIMEESPVACDSEGQQRIVVAAAWSQKYVLAQGGAPMHGAVWHEMLKVTTNKSDAFEYWAVSERLCNFTNTFLAVSWSCFHGSGHAMLLSGMGDARRMPCASPSRKTYPLDADDLTRPASLCSAGPSAQHAFLCADGLFDQYFQVSTQPAEDDLWPGVCTTLSPFSGPCFNNYIAGIKLYWPNNKMRHGYLAFETTTPSCATVMRTEAHNKGCIFGLTRNQFTFWRWHQHETPYVTLVQWCKLVVDTARLEPDIRYGRWMTCIAASMFGLNFGFGLSNESNYVVEQICAGLRHEKHLRRAGSAVSLCLSIGWAAVVPSTADAVNVLPRWLAH